MINAILEQLASRAASLLSGGLVASTASAAAALRAFAIGAQGGFPYYWQNPNDLSFNAITYGWINSNLRAGAMPIQLDQTFTGYCITALGAISYRLSSADSAKLTSAQQAAITEQTDVLQAWKSAFGSLPSATATQQPIDIVLSTIATRWANPATDLAAMQSSSDITTLLNNVPNGGTPVVSAVQKYLEQLNSDVALQNATTMNTAYLEAALDALQTPATSNGALQTDDGVLHPAWTISTPLKTILAGLAATDQSVTLHISVSRTPAGQYSAAVDTSAPLLFDAAGLGVFGVLTPIITTSDSADIEMVCTGVTTVDFGPVAFDPSTGQNWFWMLPITQAIANGSRDVSGFFFSPSPGIDFSSAGPFAYLTSVAISNQPAFTVQSKGTDQPSLAQQLGEIAPGFAYAHSISAQPESGSVQVTLAPNDASSNDITDSRAWVLGVITQFPAG